jgi:hypothetical protein
VNECADSEQDPASRTKKFSDQVPDENRMVKKFRRPAAGIEEQIPSDLRTPRCLKRTVNFLVDNVIGQASSMEAVHSFVWDRSRGIRNDFSVQQFDDLPSLKIQISCLERIVRFHILSRHLIGAKYKFITNSYDHHQDLEQGFKALYSLLAIYDILHSSSYRPPNEPEFQAYKILTMIDQGNMDAVQTLIRSWPDWLKAHSHIQHAYRIFEAAITATSSDKVAPALAQTNIMNFWSLIEQPQTTYLLACAAEIFFQLVRKSAMWAILRHFVKNKGQGGSYNWSLNDLKTPLGLDTEEEARELLDAHDISVITQGFGPPKLEVKTSGMSAKKLKEYKNPAIQFFVGRLVESKRSGRGEVDIINRPDIPGVVIPDEDDDDDSLFVRQPGASMQQMPSFGDMSNATQQGPPAGRKIAQPRGARRGNATTKPFNTPFQNSTEASQSQQPRPFSPFENQSQAPSENKNPFAFGVPSTTQTTQNPFAPSGGFPKPSTPTPFASSPFGAPSSNSAQNANPFSGLSQPQGGNPFATTTANPFNGGSSSAPSNPFAPAPSNPPPAFQFPNLGGNSTTSGVFAAPQTSTAPAPSTSGFSFTGSTSGPATQSPFSAPSAPSGFQFGPGAGAQTQQPAGVSNSFTFGVSQGAPAVPVATGPSSAPPSFSFDFNFAGGGGAPSPAAAKSPPAFNNPFASQGGQGGGFQFSGSQAPSPQSDISREPSPAPFQFMGSAASTKRKAGVEDSAAKKTNFGDASGQVQSPSVFNFSGAPTTAASTSFSTPGTTAPATANSFSFAPVSKSTTGSEKATPSTQFKLPGFSAPSTAPSTTASETKPTSGPSFQFGPSAAQKIAEDEKQSGSSASAAVATPKKHPPTPASASDGTTPGFSFTPSKEPPPNSGFNPQPTPSQAIAMPPAPIIKATPKKVRPPTNEFGRTEKQQARWDECMDYMTKELFALPGLGILDQYIDFKMWPVFEEARLARERELAEQNGEKARITWLLRKYGKLWKIKATVLRHKRLGKERRARLEKARMERAAKHEFDRIQRVELAENYRKIVEKAEQALSRSQGEAERLVQEARRIANKRDAEAASVTPIQTPSKKLRGSVMRIVPASEPSRKVIPPVARAQQASSRASTNTRPDMMLPSEETVYTPPKPLSGAPLRNSAADPLPSKISTVRSDYFRLKAMGLKHLSPAYYKNTARWKEKEQQLSASVLPMPESISVQSDNATSFGSSKKRVRFDESVTDSTTGPIHAFGASILSNGRSVDADGATGSVKRLRFSEDAPENRAISSLKRQPEDSPANKRKHNSYGLEESPFLNNGTTQEEPSLAGLDEDEQRIARIKALTSRMAWQTDIFRDPSHNPGQLSLSLASNPDERAKRIKLSKSEDNSPSMGKNGKISDPFADARKQLPAYWFRESKFVPREEYGLGPRSKRMSTGSASGRGAGNFSTSAQEALQTGINSYLGPTPGGLAAAQRFTATNGSPAPRNASVTAVSSPGDVISLLSSDEEDNSSVPRSNGPNSNRRRFAQETTDRQERAQLARDGMYWKNEELDSMRPNIHDIPRSEEQEESEDDDAMEGKEAGGVDEDEDEYSSEEEDGDEEHEFTDEDYGEDEDENQGGSAEDPIVL